MQTEDISDYYTSRADKYWGQLGRLFKSSKVILPGYMDPEAAEKVAEETYAGFKGFLPRLPYIGGDDNMLTFTFVSSAAALAYIRVLEKRGLPVEKIGNILNEVYADVYRSLPGFVLWWLRYSNFSASHRKKLKAFARDSQQREYPGNWVMEYVTGDGVAFDYGCNYTECAVLKFFRAMDAEAYMPYVCVMDFSASNVLRTGLTRTKSLYYGADCCDFRYKLNRPSLPALPLEGLPEYLNRARDERWS